MKQKLEVHNLSLDHHQKILVKISNFFYILLEIALSSILNES